MIGFKKAFPRHSVELQLSDFSVLLKTILSGKLFKGKEIQKFQEEFGNYVGKQYVYLVQSCRLGIYLSLKSFNLEKGEEVIIPAYTHYSLPIVVKLCFLKPIPVDVEENTGNINPDLIEEKITNKTRAILISHLNGLPCRMKKIMKICDKYGLKLLEDCAQSLGAEYEGKKVGAFGTVGCFSLRVGKALTGFGGGVIVTEDKKISKEIFARIDQLPMINVFSLCEEIIYGISLFLLTRPPIFTFTLFPLFQILETLKIRLVDSLTEENVCPKCNSLFIKNISYQMANIQAAVALNQLNKIDFWNQRRFENAQILTHFLQQIKGLLLYKPGRKRECREVSYHYSLRLKDKTKLSIFRKYLLKEGIDVKIDDLLDLSRCDFLNNLKGSFPKAKKLEGNILQIPNFPSLRKEDMEEICHRIIRVYNILFD